jgi:hypothetical protein
VLARGGQARLGDLRRVAAAPALAGQRHHRVHVHELLHAAGAARGEPVGGAGDHHAAVAVAHQHDVGQLLGVDQADDVGNVVVQRDGRVSKVRALAVAGERDRMHLVAGRAQRAEHAAPHPGAAPGAVHQNVSAHRTLSRPG